jgi:hypothetical protein
MFDGILLRGQVERLAELCEDMCNEIAGLRNRPLIVVVPVPVYHPPPPTTTENDGVGRVIVYDVPQLEAIE